MRSFQGVGPYADIVEAPSPSDPRVVVKFGVRHETFLKFKERGLATAIAQYYGIVQEQLIVAEHAFRGLKRPLMLEGDMDADRPVLAYAWRSRVDFEWSGSPHDGYPERLIPPDGQTFVVLVREEQPNSFGVLGSIEKWNWVREDLSLPQAPVDWQQRYDQKLWTRSIVE